MSRYETEEEQVEAIKTWWKKNGTQALGLLLVGVIAFSGWRYWTNTQYVSSANASSLYEILQMNAQQGSFGEVSREALKLMQEQPNSPYAVGAAMLYAKYSLEKGEAEEALTQLNWVTTHAKDFQLKNAAHLTIARVQIDLKAFDKARESLSALTKANLQGAEKANLDYVTGLVALAESKEGEARAAFTSVISNIKAEKSLMGLAQMQLDDLAQ
ncbi:MAG: hypothetical protein ISEC1_P0692 [Thiomicrorhabdus sp.]|nr:MAG: hypothetical protein ISEC1_P0692 [Thiomicrorhabdus sp.]